MSQCVASKWIKSTFWAFSLNGSLELDPRGFVMLGFQTHPNRTGHLDVISTTFHVDRTISDHSSWEMHGGLVRGRSYWPCIGGVNRHTRPAKTCLDRHIPAHNGSQVRLIRLIMSPYCHIRTTWQQTCQVCRPAVSPPCLSHTLYNS